MEFCRGEETAYVHYSVLGISRGGGTVVSRRKSNVHLSFSDFGKQSSGSAALLLKKRGWLCAARKTARSICFVVGGNWNGLFSQKNTLENFLCFESVKSFSKIAGALQNFMADVFRAEVYFFTAFSGYSKRMR